MEYQPKQSRLSQYCNKIHAQWFDLLTEIQRGYMAGSDAFAHARIRNRPRDREFPARLKIARASE